MNQATSWLIHFNSIISHSLTAAHYEGYIKDIECYVNPIVKLSGKIV